MGDNRPTRERVDDEADDHGDDTDEDPVGKPLVLHVAVDGHRSFVTLINQEVEPQSGPSGTRTFIFNVRLTWKPKQMVGMTLKVEAQELILHTGAHSKLIWSTKRANSSTKLANSNLI